MRKPGKEKKIFSVLLSLLLMISLFPASVFAADETKVWKVGDLSFKVGDVLSKDVEIKHDAADREIRILTEKAQSDQKKDAKQENQKQGNQSQETPGQDSKNSTDQKTAGAKDTFQAVKEAAITGKNTWKLSELTEKAQKAPAEYQLKKADSWNGSWIITKIAETEAKDAVEIQVKAYEYVAVTEIQNVPQEIAGDTELQAKVLPENADQKQITWKLTDAGTTGAVLDGAKLKVTNAGTVKLQAVIKDGKKSGEDFQQDFTVNVKTADYSKLAELLAKIPADTGSYTEDSVAKVQQAKDNIKENLPAAQQETVNGYASELQAALDGLTLKGADYSAVDAALAKIPSDLSAYTDESVTALETAKAAVDRSRNVTEQETVNGYAAAIEAAVANLVLKPVQADYSAVDAALAKIPSDLSIYTEDSVNALVKARDDVVRDLDSSRQAEVDAFAKNLEAALAGLAVKPADYSKVDAALAKIPNDLTVYTDETIQPLLTAKNGVERGKSILDQKEVDGYATAIENALAALQVRKADYSGVEKAIQKIPADLSLYTDASVKALNDAKNSVVKERPATEQESVDGYAKKIEDAIAGLVYKDADYSKVDAAVKKIPGDLKKYTDESAKAVNDAKAAIVRGKNITEQKTVDGYAAALEKAIADLKQKPIAAQSLPKITKGVNQSGMQGKELNFTANTEAKDLKKVLLDQKELDAKNYVVSGKDNTQVTLKAEYTKNLAEGKHTISLVFTQGQADAVFYLKKAAGSPETGDSTQIALWLVLLGISAAAGIGAVVYRKREKK